MFPKPPVVPAPFGWVRTVQSPLNRDMLRQPTPELRIIQFQTPLSDADYQLLAKWMGQYPELELRAYGRITDLEFLRHFPELKRFRVDSAYSHLQSIDGLRHLRDDAASLGIGWTKRRLDLSILGRFTSLESLYLEGQTRGIAVVSRLTSLEELTLRSVSLPDLALLVPLERLLSLDIKLGGTNNLALLPKIGRLRYVELWRIRGLTDISMIGQLPELRYLFLQTLNRIAMLPSLDTATSLRRVHLETMKVLHDLRPLARAPAVEELLLVDMPQLSLDEVAVLKASRSLRRVSVGLGSLSRNAKAEELLGLPDVNVGFDWRSDR